MTVPRGCFFCGSFMLFLSCFVILSWTSVCWCLVVTCWERADLLARFVMSNCDVVTFPLVSWSGVVLDCINSWSLPSFLLNWSYNSKLSPFWLKISYFQCIISSLPMHEMLPFLKYCVACPTLCCIPWRFSVFHPPSWNEFPMTFQH